MTQKGVYGMRNNVKGGKGGVEKVKQNMKGVWMSLGRLERMKKSQECQEESKWVKNTAGKKNNEN